MTSAVLELGKMLVYDTQYASAGANECVRTNPIRLLYGAKERRRQRDDVVVVGKHPYPDASKIIGTSI